MVKLRDRFGGMVRFMGGLRCKEMINSVIIDLIIEMNYSCNYMEVFFFFKYKYSVKTCMRTTSALQIINLNVYT